ncbi:MAG TPA: endonuclease/exonuclease/phosphatase family protein [Marinagarivorans sp.]
MAVLNIRDIQGKTLYSEHDGNFVTTQGVVIGILRKGFYLQTPDADWDGQRSDAIFIFGDSSKVQLGYHVQVAGECVNYLKHATARPVTQLKMQTLFLIEETGPQINPIVLTAELLPDDGAALTHRLNSLEGMLVTLPKGAIFIAPSNPFGDYVCALPHHFQAPGITRTHEGGIIVDGERSESWFPGFRLPDYALARKVNVGDTLLSDVSGPLHYRVDSWQIAASQAFDVDHTPLPLTQSELKPSNGAITVLTLNCFNLDPHIESPAKVNHPRLDVDDDWGDARFHTLVQAIVLQANLPDVIALQEIQDNDGAEITGITSASNTYKALIELIKILAGKTYGWVDIPPEDGADGGQPGGNIRNAYLYNTERVRLDRTSVQRIGDDEACFIDSRKALAARFEELSSGQGLTLINVHLVSKRQQHSLFAPENPGLDPRENIRIAQAEVITRFTQTLSQQGQPFYITGDFNDTEHSATLQAFTGTANANLVLTLPPAQRFDYNHRGKLQVLMHGVMPKALLEAGKVAYEIIHGNELIGVEPGTQSDKPSDHAYVIAKIQLT